ncbi:MAG: TlpA disulfide reductase family protein [Bacteroidales bacterium]
MRKYLALLLSATLLLAACGQETIELQGLFVEGHVGDTVELHTFPKVKGESTQLLATAIINPSGEFVFKGRETKELLPDKYRLKHKKSQFDLFLDYGVTSLLVEGAFSKSKVSGSATDSLSRAFTENGGLNALMMMGIGIANMQFQKEGKEMPDSVLSNFQEMLKALGNKKKEICAAALEDGGLALAYIVATEDTGLFELAGLNEAYKNLTAKEKASYYGIEFKKALDKLNHLAIGAKAPDFTSTTPEGENLSLYKFIAGKRVVLIDFWASWCAPCRKENPNVKALYDMAHDKGFDIIAVSLDDDRDKWLKAIEDDGLTWSHVSDLGGWQEGTAKLYNVSAVPSTFLIDGNGVILAKNLRGDELKDKVLSICQ